MEKTALLIHGAFGSPNENWFPWLKLELEALGYNVLVPKFPTPENQNLENWTKVVQPYLSEMNQDSILIGHSLGVPFGLRVLEMVNAPISAFYGVSGFVELLNNSTFDEINTTFTERNFNWSKIKTNGNNFFLYHGDKDPFVPMVCAENLANLLGVSLNVIPNGEHLNESAGFTELPQLLKDIQDICKSPACPESDN